MIPQPQRVVAECGGRGHNSVGGLPNVRTRAPKVARASQPWQEVTAPLELPRASPTWQATELRPPPDGPTYPRDTRLPRGGEIKTGVSTRTDTRRQNREPGEKLRAAFASLTAFPAWKVIFLGQIPVFNRAAAGFAMTLAALLWPVEASLHQRKHWLGEAASPWLSNHEAKLPPTGR